jgi:hypothetical protein
MAAAEYNFTIEQGSSYTTSFIYKNSDNNPIDLTGWCARMILTTSDNQTIVYSSDNQEVSQYKMTIDDANGKIVLMIPSDITNVFTFKTARYDLELESNDALYSGGGNYVTRILYGKITIVKRNSLNPTAMEC